MKQLFLIALLFINGVVALSQAFPISDLNTLYDHYTLERSKGFAIDHSRYERIAGSPYLNEQFAEGEVIINDTIRFDKVSMRYNIFTEKIEYKDVHDRILEVNTSGHNFDFIFDNHHFKMVKYTDRSINLNGPLELLVDGEIQLFRRYLIEFKEETKAKGYEDPKPNRFVRKNDTFLVAIAYATPETVYRRRDLILKLDKVIPDLNDYVKNQSVRMGTEKSVIDLVVHCNKVLKEKK